MSDEPISDDEVLLRRIPSGKPWLEPPDRVTSANFKLGRDDKGLSVFRERFVSEAELLKRPDAIEGSLVVRATAGEVRRAKNGKQEPLNLDVIPVDHDTNPGHAEIRGQFTASVAGALKRLFLHADSSPSDGSSHEEVPAIHRSSGLSCAGSLPDPTLVVVRGDLSTPKRDDE